LGVLPPHDSGASQADKIRAPGRLHRLGVGEKPLVQILDEARISAGQRRRGEQISKRLAHGYIVDRKNNRNFKMIRSVIGIAARPQGDRGKALSLAEGGTIGNLKDSGRD
jgi:hypothetical protein